MKNLVNYITEYNQIKDDIDVADIIKQAEGETRVFMIYYGNDMIVDVVSYDSEDDITQDEERTTDRVTAKIWKAEVGESVKWGTTIWCRIK
jgi:hypothetical protein